MLTIIGLVLLAALLGAGLWLYTPDRSRAALEARYAAEPSRFVEVAGLRIHLRDTGPRDAGPRDGPAVLLLHGFGASLHTWEPWAQALADTHRVIRLDLPGFGLTGADPTGDYSDTRTLDVLAALLDQLGVARVSLVGNSMGGRFAWLFAARWPDRTHRLVLISPDGFASRGLEYGRAPRVPPTLRLLPYVLPMPLLRASLRPGYGDPAVLTPELLERYRDLLLAPGVRTAIIDRTAQTIREDPEPLLRRITAPTLLVWGERDRMIPVSNAADYARLLPDSRTVTFPELGHLPQEEAPARSLPPVAAFLAE